MAEKKGVECAGVEERRQMIDRDEPRISIRQQCRMLGLRGEHRQQRRNEAGVRRDDTSKRVILERLLKEPCLGYRRLTTHVGNALGCRVNEKYVRRLMKELGVRAIYCLPDTSKPHRGREKSPYLLKNMRIDRPDMVWTTDITYLKSEGRTYYLSVVMDWASREVPGYSVGRNMTVELCHESLTMALATGRCPAILNTDQGSQYTSESWTLRIQAMGIRASMDGKGSWRDNVRMERFWRTYKYELFNLYDDVTLESIRKRLGEWDAYYNSERLHSALGNKTPEKWRKERHPAA